MGNKDMKFAVLGAGCGGQTMAGHLASEGYDVNLYNRSAERLGNLPEDPVVSLEGVINSEGMLRKATTDIAEALDGSDIIMIVTTASGHKEIARSMAGHLHDGQIIVLNPGRTFGSLEIANEVYRQRPQLDVTICEANTLIYATRVLAPGRAKVHGVKDEVALAALIPQRTAYVIDLLKEMYPQMRAADNVLATSLGNIGAVFHPTIMLLNYQRIKKGEPFEFYCEGVTDTVAFYMKGVDKERQAIAAELGAEIPTLEEWLTSRYSLSEDNLKDLLQNNPAYQGIYAPMTVEHRYLFEDVPTGLVPLSLIGKALGIDTPHMDFLIAEANLITGRDFVSEGRTLRTLGLTPSNIKDELQGFIYRPPIREVASR